MSIGSTDVTAGPYTTNGATTQFSFSFRVADYGATEAEDQLKVILVTNATGAETVLTRGTNAGQYTVTVNGDQDSSPGGSITTITTYAAGYTIWIRTNPTYLQETELSAQTGYSGPNHEAQFDQFSRQILDLRDKIRRMPLPGVQVGESFNGEVTGTPVAGYLLQLNDNLTGFDYVANNGSSNLVTATGSTTARTLADRFAEYVRPEDFGAVGDGVTDDTAAMQAALDSMSASECLVLRPGATYSVQNVKLPTLIAAFTGRAGIACMFGTATIKARAGGDTGYLVAGKKWITATKTDFSNEPWLFENVIFDANGVSDWAVILKTYWGRYTNCDFINGVVGGCKLTRQNQDGSAIDSGALNPGNVFDRCFFQDNGTYAFRNEGTAANAAAASTDCWLVNCGFDGNAVTDYNIYMGTCDGWQIRGNHTSGSTVADAYFLSVGIAASIGGNEFEGLVIVGDVGAYGYCQIGPANMFRTGLRYDGADDTGAEVCTVVGNNFHQVAGGSKAQCTLNDNSRSAKVLFGINNSFEHAKPYVRGSSASGVLKWSGGYSTDGVGNLGDGQYDNGATEGPYDDLFSDSDSPANSDIVGVRRHLGRDSAGNWQEYAATRGVIGSPTNGSENGRYEIRVTRSGASVTKLSFGGGIFGTGMSDTGDGTINMPTAYYTNGTKVVGTQGAAVADASGGATVDTEARAAINALLARLRAHGLIAT